VIKQHKGVLAFIIIFSILIPSFAYADDPSDEAFPSVSELFEGKNKSIYLTKYKDNYYLDMVEYSFFKDMEGVINIAANVLFKMQYYCGLLLVTMIYYAYEMPIYDFFSGIVDEIVKQMKESLFDELSLIAIVLIGIYFVIKMLSEQKTQVWTAMIQIVVVIALAMAFYTGPSEFLKAVDDGTDELSKIVLAGTYKATNKGEDPDKAVMAAANDVWIIFVHRPWQILEFGSVEMAKDYEDKILSLKPKSKARQKIIEDIAKDEEHFTTDWGIKRVGYLIFSFIPNLVLFLVILVLCLLIWAYKILTIIFCLLGIFVFILALIPMFGGIRLLQSWGSKVIGSGAVTVVVSFFLAVVFAFNSAVFKLIDVYGLLVIILLQLVVAAVVYIKRESLFEMFTMVRLAASGAVPVNKQMRRDTNIESKVLEYTRNLGIRRNKGYENEGYESREGSSSESSIRKGTNQYKEALKSEPSFTGETVSFKDLYNEIEEDTKSDNENFKALMKKAEEILERQYEILTKTAEERAEKLGKEPEYHPFVYKVKTRQALGVDRFDNREIVAAAKELQRVLNAGGSEEDLIRSFEKEKDTKIERPKNLIEIRISDEKVEIDRDEAEKIEIKDLSKDYVNEFNKDYNKNYDPEFMEELIKKYGHEQVRYMLDKMKQIQLKEKSIYNPAGYLIKGLKSNERDNVVAGKTINNTVKMRNKEEDYD
jgi:hypothetical protein